MQNEDIQLRLNSLRRLSTIALALGEQRTRDELVPFLQENTDDEDEVLQALAEELGGFVAHVGGPEHAHCLLAPLETLSMVEETVVRDKAVESMSTIGAVLPEAHLVEYFCPLIKVRSPSLPLSLPLPPHHPPHRGGVGCGTQRLASGEWFTARVSSCALFAVAYPRAPTPVRTELLSQFVTLCHDETPMVRRAAAHHLGQLAATMEREYVKTEIMALFTELTQDDQVLTNPFELR